MTLRYRVAAYAMIALSLASLAQAIIMCAEVGIGAGWLLVRNDPGKFIFHLLLLPVAFGSLLLSFPTSLARDCIGRGGIRRIAIVGIGGVFAVYAIVLGLSQAVEGFEQRVPVPTDVRAEVMRDAGAPRNARGDLLLEWQKYHDMNWAPASPAAGANPQFPEARAAGYAAALNRVLGEKRDFWSQASVAAWWAGFLNVLGVWFICAWALTIVIVTLEHERLDDVTIAQLVMAFCTGLASAGVWFYFKIYSEWYINFYAVPTPSLTPLIMVIAAAVILAVAAILLQNPREPLKSFSRISVVGGLVTGAVAKWSPGLFRSVADAYRLASDSIVVGLWLVMALTAFVASYLIAAGPKSAASSPSPARNAPQGG